jgi:hypothetical protein
MSKTYVLFACDGTGSTSWRKGDGSNSYIFQFYNRFKSNVAAIQGKKYLDGPPEWHGWGTYNLFNEGLEFVESCIDQTAKKMGFSPKDKKTVNQQMGICLAGHSRGGLVAIKIANLLSEKGIDILFLGLLDAVRMALPYKETIPRTVGHFFHGIRDQNFYSRYTWGNAGTHYEDGAAAPVQKYKTSHGGLGGDPNFQYSDSLKTDQSFTETYQLGDGRVWNTPSHIFQNSRLENINRLKSLGVRLKRDNNLNLPTLEQLGKYESQKAFQDFLRVASDAGLPV